LWARTGRQSEIRKTTLGRGEDTKKKGWVRGRKLLDGKRGSWEPYSIVGNKKGNNTKLVALLSKGKPEVWEAQKRGP